MRKYRPVTTFMGVHQYDALRVLAAATHHPSEHLVRDESISSLTRVAVMRYLQDIEEWQDAVEFNRDHADEHITMRNGRRRASAKFPNDVT